MLLKLIERKGGKGGALFPFHSRHFELESQMQLFRCYVAVLGVFEVVSIVRLLYLNEPLVQVAPLFVKSKANEDLSSLFATFIGILAVGRFAYAYHFHSSTMKWLMVAIHASEVPFFVATYMRNVLPLRVSMDQGDRLGIEIITAVICLNPLLFALFGGSTRKSTRGGPGVKKTQ